MMRAPTIVAATAIVGFAAPALAQDHSMQGMNMPGMSMPMPAAKKKPASKTVAKRRQPAKAKPRTRPTPAPAKASATPMSDMPGMDHSAMPGMTMPAQGAQSMPGMQMPGDTHAGHAMPGMAMEGMAQTGTTLPAGNAPPPPVPIDHAADRVYGADAMTMGRHHLQQHHGGGNFYQVMLNLAEYQFRNGRDGYRWDGEAWYGGDINRLFVKTEGEGTSAKALIVRRCRRSTTGRSAPISTYRPASVRIWGHRRNALMRRSDSRDWHPVSSSFRARRSCPTRATC